MISGFVFMVFPMVAPLFFDGTTRRSPLETRQKRRVELPAALHASWLSWSWLEKTCSTVINMDFQMDLGLGPKAFDSRSQFWLALYSFDMVYVDFLVALLVFVLLCKDPWSLDPKSNASRKIARCRSPCQKNGGRLLQVSIENFLNPMVCWTLCRSQPMILFSR